MTAETDKKRKIHLAASSALTATGLLLLIYMIIFENEPGAIPLAMILTGAGWLYFALSKKSSHNTN
ncbi:hypothetical protein [Rhodohalobacter mucosus]|uniref:Uncharacterized protein n=1 Tax=Rhodohalobacter mucosus TaxID=2079485 RepID=A0A316TPG1_9BACT|nr:hypothetical protein [Rhodohalobacter mucosus]PWN05698.1 hypothetical protein DDZ15_14020 [Rhodohalobacter mucosus]